MPKGGNVGLVSALPGRVQLVGLTILRDAIGFVLGQARVELGPVMWPVVVRNPAGVVIPRPLQHDPPAVAMPTQP